MDMSNNKKQPDQLLIDSMAMRYRHDFGLLTFEEQQSIRVTMTQLWEEVVGLGFYKPKHKQMSNNKQSSSVEWLIKEFSEILGPIKTQPMQTLLLIDAFNKAKEMHKEEIKDAWDKGDYCIDLPDGTWEQKYKSAEQYYNETFGGNHE